MSESASGARYDVNLFRLITSAKKNILWLIVLPLASGLIAFGVTQILPKKYAYNGLIQVTQYSSGIAQFNLDPSEVMAIVDFNFNCNIANSGLENACIETVGFMGTNTRVIKVTIVSDSLALAEAALDQVLEFVRQSFEFQVRSGIDSAMRRLDSINVELEQIPKAIDGIEKRLLSSTNERLDLAMQRDNMRKEIFLLKQQAIDLETGMKIAERQMLRFVAKQPTSQSPVFPRVRLIIALGIALGLGLAALVVYSRAPKYD